MEGAATAGDEDDVEWLESMGDLDLRTVLDDPNLTLAGARQPGGGKGQGEQGSRGAGCSALVLTCRICFRPHACHAACSVVRCS